MFSERFLIRQKSFKHEIVFSFFNPCSRIVTAQRWHVNVTGGVSNYSGDLQGKNYTFDQSFFAFGAGVQYDITRNFSASVISVS